MLPRPWIALIVALVFIPSLVGRAEPVIVSSQFTGGEPVLHAAWSIVEGASLRTQAIANAPISVASPLAFLEPCLILAGEPQGKEDDWLLVARRSTPGVPAGWVLRKHLLTTSSARFVPGTRVPQALVVTNTVLSLQPPGVEALVDAPLRKAPDVQSPQAGAARMMELLFCYGETSPEPAHARPPAMGSSPGFLLVGAEPAFVPDAEGKVPGSAVLGWIAKDMTLGYYSRYGVAWDRASTLSGARPRRPSGGRIFRGRRSAYAPSGNAIDPLFEEQTDEDGASLIAPPSMARMPLLPILSDDDYPEIDPLTNNQLVAVAGLGALLASDEKPPTRSEAESIRSELARLREQLTTGLQILFVIDDTRSMELQFPRVAETVNRIIKDATASSSRSVEIAVAFYNDTMDGDPLGYRTMALVDARSDQGQALPAMLKRHALQLHGGEDYPEMLGAGLLHAIDDAGFEKRTGANRLIVVIGDHGNKTGLNQTGPPDYDSLLEALTKAGRAPIELVAFQVIDAEKSPPGLPPTYAEKYLEAARGYREHMSTLVNRLNATVSPGGRRLGSFVPMPDEGVRLTSMLDDKYDEMKRREEELNRKWARLVSRGFPTKTGKDMDSLLRDRHAPLERLRELGGVRVGAAGFVWRWWRPPAGGRAGTPQVRLEVLLSRLDAQQLVAVLDPVFSARDVREALRNAAGSDPGETLEHAMLDPRGLPAGSLLFKRPAGSISATLAAAELPAARARLARLRALATAMGADAPRWFRIRDAPTDWCWFDAETEIP
jgi:hypothetical protein